MRLRSWLVLAVLAAGVVLHKPVIGVVIAVLVALSMLASYLHRRKQRDHA